MNNDTSRMLINARNPLELRVALVKGETLQNFKVDVAQRGLTRGNIYFGYIANIQPSLNAAFIDYGAERHGFLPIQDVVPDAYYKQVKGGQRPRIEDVLEKGRPIVVQVTREPEGQKGAALTTNLSLAGRYLVLMPFEQARGISRKVGSDEERRKLRDLVKRLDIPSDIGVIVRTNALNQTKTALMRDLNALMRLWKKIGTDARESKKTKLLYTDQDIVLQALRDYLDSSVEQVLVDEEAAFAKSEEYMNAFMPRSKTALVRYEDRTPLFSKFKIEEQIERIFQRQVSLHSGGSIVIDPTEALTAIDVNSGRSTKASSQEETAVHTNVEAAEEVARQLRMRDIGGLIVVDFIDMRGRRNQSKVEKTLRDAMKSDKARNSVGRISSNGLVEINRQRLEQAVQLRTHSACPTCDGTGRIESPELVALHLVRQIEARASTGFMKGCQIALHPDLAHHMQNKNRQVLARLEEEFDLEIEITASTKLHRPEQDITWFAKDRNEIKKLEEERQEAERTAAEFANAASIAGNADAEEAPEVVVSSDVPDAAPEDRPKKKRRRRGGRRRSKARMSSENESSEETTKENRTAESDIESHEDTATASDADSNAADGDDAPRQRRAPRRRRPSRRSTARAKGRATETSATDTSATDNSATDNSANSPDSDIDSQSADNSAEANNDEPRARRSRPRARRSRRTDAEERPIKAVRRQRDEDRGRDEDSNSTPDAAETQSDGGDRDNSGSDNDVSAKPTRREPRRRRPNRRARATGDNEVDSSATAHGPSDTGSPDVEVT